jgi:hypothetical protein
MARTTWKHEVGALLTLGQLVRYGEQHNGGTDPYQFVQEDYRVAEIMEELGYDNRDEHDPLSTKFPNLCVLEARDEDGNFDGYLEVWGVTNTGGGLHLEVERIL